jgi:protein CWC15
MTTAHRPTWAPAMGHEEQGGLRQRVPTMMQSAKSMPSQLRMKTRQAGQATAEEVERRDLRAELEARERKHAKLDKREDFERAISRNKFLRK